MPRPSRRPPPVAAALAAAVALLTGCADGAADREEGATGLEGAVGGILEGLAGLGGGATTVAYDCDGGRELTAAFSADRGEVRVEAEDEDGDEETYALELLGRRGDRRVYSDDDGGVQLVVRGADGDEAELRIDDGDDFEDCRREM
jgi:hypothetical protein